MTSLRELPLPLPLPISALTSDGTATSGAGGLGGSRKVMKAVKRKHRIFQNDDHSLTVFVRPQSVGVAALTSVAKEFDWAAEADLSGDIHGSKVAEKKKGSKNRAVGFDLPNLPTLVSDRGHVVSDRAAMGLHRDREYGRERVRERSDRDDDQDSVTSEETRSSLGGGPKVMSAIVSTTVGKTHATYSKGKIRITFVIASLSDENCDFNKQRMSRNIIACSFFLPCFNCTLLFYCRVLIIVCLC